MSALLPWAWVLPLPGLLLTALGAGRRPGVASVPGPFLLLAAALLWLVAGAEPATVVVDGWLPFLPDGALRLRADGLSVAMLAVVGFVAACVYVYSLAYMEGDPGQRRFFAYLDLFVAAMAVLVLAGNLAVLLVGWTGVGLASFLLISFWWERPGTVTAGLEALAANAIGDAALLLAAVLVPVGCGDLTTLGTAQCTNVPGGPELLATLLVVAAAAKSAQGPLYFWLPSAMAGPTPVSALIHAATMVAAGVYLLVRVSPLLALAPSALSLVAALGTATAVLGGVASLRQANFKRGLAYSTVSQLGYMFAAVGVGAPFAAFFHLVTHASFKALLFLSAGAVIHSVEGEEDLGRLGGLRRALPGAYIAFLVGSLALVGLPLTAGALSKDAILESALHAQPLIGWMLLGGTFVTGLYIGRLFFAVFHGEDRVHPVHRPSSLLLWPLVPLGVGALALGYLEMPGGALSAILGDAVAPPAEPVHLVTPLGLAAAALGLLGFGVAGWWMHQTKPGGVLAKPAGGWVGAMAGMGRALAVQVATTHSGQLSRYVIATLVGTALILLLGARL